MNKQFTKDGVSMAKKLGPTSLVSQEMNIETTS